jgi:1,4-alpha-glucan branching enzyme
MKLGSFTFVLHSHIPYVRKAGRWPHGEEMLHEVMAETYIPLLNALYDLKAEGIEPRLTIGLTPILLEQIGDADVQNHFELYLQERLALVELDILRFEKSHDEHRTYLARGIMTDTQYPDIVR